LHVYEFSYKFDTVLYQFLETGSSDKYTVQRLRFSGFILYPLSFFLYSPSKVHALHTSSNDDEMINVRVKYISMFSISPIKEIQHCRRKTNTYLSICLLYSETDHAADNSEEV